MMISGSLEDKIQSLLQNSPENYSDWILLIIEIEKSSPDDIAAVSKVYETFLSEFPLCYGYWEKYATHKARLCSTDKVIEVYEEAVKVATYSVDLWANYCSFSMKFYTDINDVRRLYERSLASVEKDYNCDILWDKCIAFEHSHKHFHHLVYIYIRSLRFPTKKLHSYYRSFRELVAIWEEEINCQYIAVEPLDTAAASELVEMSMKNVYEFRNHVLDQTGDLRPEALKKILTIGEYFYLEATKIDNKIHYFEGQIRRPYFHVRPLDKCQLQIWHQYLDFVEMQADLDWTVKLYERCLIPCANYPEFWVRYIEVMELRGGREIANLALARALKTFLKRNFQFQLYCSKVMEQVRDIDGAHAALSRCDSHVFTELVNHVNQQANMEKRLGNIRAAYFIYEKAIDMVKEQDIQAFSALYMHFARFTYVVTGDLGTTREVFAKGISRVPECKSLFKELMTFLALHGGHEQVGAVDSIVEHAIVPEHGMSMPLSPSDQEDVSSFFLEFVDLCGTIHEIRKAWARHIKLFPHALRNSGSFSCYTDDIGMPENSKKRTGAQDGVHEKQKGNAHTQFLTEDLQPSREHHNILLDEPVLAIKSHSEMASNSTNGNLEQIQQSENTKIVCDCKAIELPEDTTEVLHETQHFSPHIQEPTGCLGIEHQSQQLPNCESHDDLRPSLEKLSITRPDYETLKDHDDNSGQLPSIKMHACEGNEVETTQQSDDSDRKSVVPAISHVPEDTESEVLCSEQNLNQAAVNLSQNQLPVQEHINPINSQSSLNWHLLKNGQLIEHQAHFYGHAQTQHHQQWQAPIQSLQTQCPRSGFNSQASVSQPYACQSQLWQSSTQMANQLHCQFQMANPHIYSSGSIAWQPPNTQPNLVTGGQPQLVNQVAAQTYVYQHSLSIPEQQCHFRGGHNVSQQFLNYYQQQLSHKQQYPVYDINPQQPQQHSGQQQIQAQRNNIHQWQQQNQQQTNHIQLQGWQLQQQLHQPQNSQPES